LGVDLTDTQHVLAEQFGLFVLILIFYTVVNIFADRFLAVMNNISVWWHVLGILIVIGVLVFVPDHHQSAHFVLTDRINLSTVKGGATGGLGFFLLVLPVGFTVTMYTMTGYDASAHTAEETRGAAKTAAQGLWRSAFYSGIAGWFVLLAFLFAATDVGAVNDAAGFPTGIFTSALD